MAISTSQPIGFVTVVQGSVSATSTEGVTRVLQVGDAVFADDTLITGDASAVMVEFVDGSRLDLGRDSTALLDSEVFDPSTFEAYEEAVASIDAIQQAILAGQDPTQVLAATAAGPAAGGGGEGGGHDFVRIDLTGQQVVPTSGFPTTGLMFSFLEPPPELIYVEEGVDHEPSIGPEEGQVEEFEIIDQASGSFDIVSLDGVAAIRVQDKDGNWIDVTGGGSVQGEYGLLKVYSSGNWVYLLTTSTQAHTAQGNDVVYDAFALQVVDPDGDTAGNIMTIAVVDDVPSLSGQSEETEILEVDETDLSINANGYFDWNFSPDYRADGPGSVGNYTLGISAPGANSGLTDTATSQAVLLSMNGGVVEGRTETSNDLVFTVTVDSGTGLVTLDQLRAVMHSPDTGPNQATGLASSGLITLMATVTDADGDIDDATINIGHAFRFLDDAPSITVDGEPPVLSVDETYIGTTDAASFAGLFTPDGGADSIQSVGYALSVTNSTSGLVDSVSGENVVLSMNSGVVEGRTATGNALVFTVSIDGSGNVTLEQMRAVMHGLAENPDTSEPAGLDAGIIALTATVTDKDGDYSAIGADISGAISFLDDGPSISADGEIPMLSVDETYIGTTDAASFAGVFTPDGGADSVLSVGYALSVTNSTSGLVDSVSGENVVLSMNSGVVEGRTVTGNALVFTVTVDGSGGVTLEQMRAVMHDLAENPDTSEPAGLDAGTIALTATVTDKDGDYSAIGADISGAISFLDDGPSISADGVVPSLTVDESFLAVDDTASFAGVFTPDGGADSIKSVGYALSVANSDSGLVDSQSGQDVVLSMNGLVLEGRSEISNQLVFTLSVDGSGDVTLDQKRAVMHNLAENPDTSEPAGLDAGTVTLTATVTDMDDDYSAIGADISGAISFLDDGPSISSAGELPILEVDETFLAINDSANFSGVFTPDGGADSIKSVGYALGISSSGVDSGLTDSVTGESVLLYLNSGVVEGRTETSNQLVFTVSVDGGGNVTLDQLRSVIHGSADMPDTSEPVSIDAEVLSLLARVEDMDNDYAISSVDLGGAIRFLDDGPVVSGADYTRISHINGEPVTWTGSGSLDFSAGTDELGTITFEYDRFYDLSHYDAVLEAMKVTDVNGMELTSFGNNLYYLVWDGSAYVPFGSTGYESVTTLYAASYDEDSGTFKAPVFDISLDPISGAYIANSTGVMDQAASTINIDLTGGVSGGNAGWYLLGQVNLDGSGDPILTGGNAGDDPANVTNDVLVYALGAAETVNSRNGGLGAGVKGGGDASLFIHHDDGAPEGVQFNLVEGLQSDKWDHDSDSYEYELDGQSVPLPISSYRSITELTVTMGATQGNDQTSVKVLAFNSSGSQVPIVVSSADALGSVRLYNSDGTLDGDGIPDSDDYWVVDGLVEGHTFNVVTNSGTSEIATLEVWYTDSADYEYGGEGAATGFLLSSLQYSYAELGNPVDLAFDFTVTDADGDTDVGSINLAIDPQWSVNYQTGDYDVSNPEGETVYGDSGDQILTGAEGDDILVGRGGEDTIYGEGGDDILVGGGSLLDGGDQLSGGEGNDQLYGGAGTDTLDGGPGNDTLTGGDGVGGIDTFIFSAAGGGQDTVTDLEIGELLQFTDVGSTDLSALETIVTVSDGGVGGDVVISFDGTTDSITLLGIGTGSIDSMQALIDAGYNVDVLH